MQLPPSLDGKVAASSLAVEPPASGTVVDPVVPPAATAPPVAVRPPIATLPPVADRPPADDRPPELGIDVLAPPAAAMPPVAGRPPALGFVVAPPAAAMPPIAVMVPPEALVVAPPKLAAAPPSLLPEPGNRAFGEGPHVAASTTNANEARERMLLLDSLFPGKGNRPGGGGVTRVGLVTPVVSFFGQPARRVARLFALTRNARLAGEGGKFP